MSTFSSFAGSDLTGASSTGAACTGAFAFIFALGLIKTVTAGFGLGSSGSGLVASLDEDAAPPPTS